MKYNHVEIPITEDDESETIVRRERFNPAFTGTNPKMVRNEINFEDTVELTKGTLYDHVEIPIMEDDETGTIENSFLRYVREVFVI